MNCEQLRKLLDAYMDGELSDAELREMEAHAAACEDCSGEFAAAKFARQALHALPDEVAVPLSAQASWRRAVRAEAARGAKADERTVEFVRAERKSKRRWLRAAYAVAAALVLVLGASAMLGRGPGETAGEPVAIAVPESAAISQQSDQAAVAAPTEAVVARDGAVDAGAGAYAQDVEGYAARKKYVAEDLEAACATVDELVEEYGGECSKEAFERPEEAGASSVAFRIELPREYLDDFLSAVSHVGAEQDSESADAQGDIAVIYIEIEARGAEA